MNKFFDADGKFLGEASTELTEKSYAPEAGEEGWVTAVAVIKGFYAPANDFDKRRGYAVRGWVERD